ncbi:MAG TPA: right-handed parallel beta-helix repeat-containing protein [Anaerolineae bacterium]|nr:right-handed parallel beta-helix repeat-containing protein [Anaerolineae bacterium]
MMTRRVMVVVVAMVVAVGLVAGLGMSWGEMGEAEAAMSSVTVTNLNDSGPGSLREAIGFVLPGGVITFDQSLAGGTITFLSPVAVDWGMEISGNVPITLSGGGTMNLFYVTSGGLVFDGVTIRDAGVYGAIYAFLTPGERITIANSYLVDNQAFTGGVVTVESGEVMLDNVVAEGNVADQGGVLFLWTGGRGIVRGSQLIDNTANSAGGAIYNEGVVEIIDTHILTQTGSAGGALNNRGQMSVTNSFFHNNRALGGGGVVYNRGDLWILGGEMSDNRTDGRGGAIFAGSGGTIRISGTHFSRNEIGGLSGGAIYINGASGMVEIRDSLFFDHASSSEGGTIDNNNVLSVTNSSFISSTSHSGGTIMNQNVLSLTNSSFVSGVANSNGGGIYNSGMLYFVGGGMENNVAANFGGGIYVENGSWARVEGVDFVGNEGNGGRGGAIFINNSGEAEVRDSSFFDHDVSLLGGAIMNNNILSVSGSSFISNSATYGGAIFNVNELQLYDSNLISNVVDTEGGGVYNSGRIMMGGVTFERNVAAAEGGGLYNEGGGMITGTMLLFMGNEAVTRHGGGLVNLGQMSIMDSAVISNTAGDFGGGIYNRALLSVTNSTVGRNRAGTIGGGIYTQSSLWLQSSTVVENEGPYGSNLHADYDLEMSHTILANSMEGPDCYYGFGGTVVVSYTLIENNAVGNPCGVAWSTADPLLEPLADGGNGMWHYRPQGSSPVIDVVACDGLPATDQLGVARPQSVWCDIGSIEYDGALPINVRLGTGLTETWVVAGQAISMVLEVENVGGGMATDVMVAAPLVSAWAEPSYTASQMVTATAGMTYTWDLGDLMAGERVWITMTGVVSATDLGLLITTTATVTATGDTLVGDNVAALTMTVAGMDWCYLDFRGEVMGSDLLLNWSDVTNEVASYGVYRSNVPYFDVGTSDELATGLLFTHTDVGILPTTPLFYKVETVGCPLAVSRFSDEVGAFTFDVVKGN